MALRQTHVRRFWAVDENGNRNNDVWVDVERIDRYEITSGQGPQFQRIIHHLKWYDAEDPADNNPRRTIEFVNVSNPNDENQVVRIPAVARLVSKFNGGGGHKIPGFVPLGQIVFTKLRNDEESTRTRRYLRIPHREIEEEPDEDGFFERYTFVDEEPDDSEYVDFEVCVKFDTRRGQGPGFQREKHHLITHEFLEEVAVPIPEGDEIFPVRLDPFQYVINVSWGHPFLALGFTGIIGRSPDGINWTRAGDLPGGAIPFTGAYGQGMFLVGEAGGSGRVFRSTDGGTTWVEAAIPLPGKFIQNVQFGNDLFVVSALDESAQDAIHTAASVDGGETWVIGSVEESGSLANKLAFSGGKFLLPGQETEVIEGVQTLIGVVWHQNGDIETVYGAPGEVSITTGLIHSSADGMSWVQSGEILPGIEFPGAEAFVTVTNPFTGQTAEIARTLPPLSNVGAPNSVVYIVPYGPDEGPIMATAAFGGSTGTYITTSFDGVSWTPDQLEGGRTGGATAYGDGRWIGAGQQFPGADQINMASVDNGASWTSAIASPAFTAVDAPPAFGKGVFVHVQSDKIYTSPDGLAWTESPQSLGEIFFHRVIY